jgi:drug/metabolite transporter (DMT)-like permease
MPRVYLAVLAVGLFVYALSDCLQAQTVQVLPKWAWLLVITCLPIFGPLAWLLFGRYWGGGGWWEPEPEPAPDPRTRQPVDHGF